MSKNNENLDTYIIPPNFIESGTFFGGAFKIRNAMEAGALVLLMGLPILGTSMGVTAKIITLCFTALPLGIFGLIGVDGMSLSTFVYGFIKFLRNRRVLRNRAVLGQLDAVLPDKKRRQSKKLGDGSIESFLPIERIENGIVCTKDGRFLKILELEPINFLLRSAREQRRARSA